jgi:hypothetical protein
MNSDGTTVRATALLDETSEIIRERGLVYGSPSINHLRIAKLWSVYLERAIEPEQVAVCMALVKIARLVETGDHLDSYKDAAAYLAIAAEISYVDWDDLDAY